ncbi:Na+/H+ antiporter [Nonomuraea sp. NPDC050783]|uniref:Na+/H+ antiporter n=1 Tax=Nonomuraea sp. NPDC050783 TaxID=3154634 RepID=UPI0034670BA0
MGQFVLLVLVLLGALITVPLGERLGLPSPVLMTLLGIVLAVLPFVPNVDVPPGIVLPLLLPPLLYAAARRVSWRQFAANWRPIFLLAVALVFVTTAAVAAVAHALVSGLPLAAAVALGALVAPPDPVAATAVAGRLGLPRRMVALLEGEGLFNDVTAIVLYHVAIMATVTGVFSWPGALAEFALSAVVAVLVGLGLGWLSGRLMDLLGDATLQVGLSLLVPFVSYALADELHGSGVLAVLTSSFYLGDRMADADDVLGRFAAGTFWQVVETLVTGVAFGLIGLELHVVIGTMHGRLGPLLGWSAAVVAAVVLVRLLWLLPAAWLAKKAGGKACDDSEIPLTWRETVVMWWAGMRGVASVALALAIPLTLADGSSFPERSAIVFVAFAVILVTLVAQGLTLPWLVTRLGVKADTAAERELEKRLAVAAAKAAKRRLREIDAAEDLPEDVVEQLTRRMLGFGLRISPEAGEEERQEAYEARARRVRLVRRVQGEMLSAARQVVLDARRDPYVDPAVVSRVLRRLDARSLR